MKLLLGTQKSEIFSGQKEPTGMTPPQRQSITTGFRNSEGLITR